MSKEPTKVTLTDTQKLALELEDTKLRLVKHQVRTAIEQQYLVQMALAVEKALNTNTEVVAAASRLQSLVKSVVASVEDTLPDGVSVTSVSWIDGTVTTSFDEERKQKDEATRRTKFLKRQRPSIAVGDSGGLPTPPGVRSTADEAD